MVETTIKDHESIIYRNAASDLFMNVQDVNKVDYSKFSCLIFTGTCLAKEPSRSAIIEAISLAKKNNLPVVFDIDYRPYTWKSTQEASKTYLKAAEVSDIVIGNDDEFAVMAQDYNEGIKLAQKLNKYNIQIMGSSFNSLDIAEDRGRFSETLKKIYSGNREMAKAVGADVAKKLLEK